MQALLESRKQKKEEVVDPKVCTFKPEISDMAKNLKFDIKDVGKRMTILQELTEKKIERE